MARLYLKKNEDQRIRSGHLWVFSNEMSSMEETAVNGDIIDVFDYRGNSVGSGFYNENSLISVRLFEKSYSGNINGYIREHLHNAYNLRKSFYPHRNSFRMCLSESDFLPGLIIDKYISTFVLQVYCFGMQRSLDEVIKVLKEDFEAKNIFSRNDSHFRKIEGLEETDEIYHGSENEEIIDDGKIKYRIDFKNSQKTGFYFDQCDNRVFSEHFVNGKTVLDAFCNCGGFGLHASMAGAKSVDFLDSSAHEIENAGYNFGLNKHLFKGITGGFIRNDVFDYLGNAAEAAKKYDVVILDPPAFAKNKKSVPAALKGYEKLNKLALQIINKNGFLITSSCSHHVSIDEFIKAINKAAGKAQRQVRLLYLNGASLDHPRLTAMPETSYLKFAVFHVT